MSVLPDDAGGVPPHAVEAWYIPIVEFATHIVVGTSIFLFITAAAWVIHLATVNIGKSTALLYYGLRSVEAALFVADTLLFLVFIARTTWRTLRKLLKGWQP